MDQRRVTNLAGMQPDPEVVEHYRQALAAQTKETRAGYALGYTASLVREAAADHLDSCDGCSTCQRLERTLAFVVAYELEFAPSHVLRMLHGMDDET
ncbi:hypothetical protein [Micromonospora sp. NPDC023633]|uniref:hypothetical protein n=1 Tax=Micromonospora sp. NPDC023633 TaxID=3154320 RepID=UPI0033C7D5C9